MFYRCISVVLLMVLLAGMTATAQSPARKADPQDTAAIRDFESRLDRYVKDRKNQAGTMAKATKSAATLKESREQMRARIQANRANAKQGEVFTPDIAKYFHKQLAQAFHGPSGTRVLTSLRHSEPVKKIRLTVNQPYPEGVPLQSMPPSLLMKLPKLPKELEYRIVGRDLVLIDTEPKLVVDVLSDAVPQA